MQDRRAHTEQDAAELEKRQHFRRRIPNHSCPDEDPRSRGGVGQQDVPGATQQEEYPQSVEAEDRKTTPPDRDGRRKHRGRPDMTRYRARASPKPVMRTMRSFMPWRRSFAANGPAQQRMKRRTRRARPGTTNGRSRRSSYRLKRRSCSARQRSISPAVDTSPSDLPRSG